MSTDWKDIQEPPPAGNALMATLAVSGPAIPPQQRLLIYSADDWEEFVQEWAHYCLKKTYKQVQRFTGAGDMGIDIADSALIANAKRELEREGASFDRRMPATVRELEAISDAVDGLISPKLSKLRATYAEFADKRGEVREALALYASVQDMERRRAELESNLEAEKTGSLASAEIQTTVADSFAQTVESILKDWHFPEAGRVYFDPKARDLIISGKSRSAFGKGLRAITYAAFTLGLLVFCRTRQTPHTGFVVIDSPLLAYREPDGDEDDLQGTDLQEQFYTYLQTITDDTQVIVVENTDPPESVRNRDLSLMFSKNPHHGRYGLFPHTVASTE